MKVIRDAVWGDIEVDEAATALLDTREMQRLRGVKQLGTASLVYPSAVHTRFEHALGTMHLARRVLLRVPGALGRAALPLLRAHARRRARAARREGGAPPQRRALGGPLAPLAPLRALGAGLLPPREGRGGRHGVEGGRDRAR